MFLAINLVEYLLEPIVSDSYEFLVSVEFNKFLANLIYAYFISDESAEAFCKAFSEMMRSTDPAQRLDDLLRLGFSTEDQLSPLLFLCEVVNENKDAILDEYQRIASNPAIKRWMLDPSLTMFFMQVGHWGHKFDSIKVIFDQSKCVSDFKEVFDNMVGRPAQKFKLGRTEIPLTANLKEPIQEVDSKHSYGVQIADVLAHLGQWFLTSKYRGPKAQQIGEHLVAHVLGQSIMADLEAFSPALAKNRALQLILVGMRDNVSKSRDIMWNIRTSYHLGLVAAAKGEI